MNAAGKYIIIIFLAAACLSLSAQESEVDSLLNQKILNENATYKPVISVGSGILNFYGDVKNNYVSQMIGNYGYKLNISTFLDMNRYYAVNFFLMYGRLSANQRSLTELAKNLNFKTDLIVFGINAEYSFSHIFKKSFIKPFISLGIENIQFTPKGDLLSAPKIPYNYWSDGTIRSISEPEGLLQPGIILQRDYVFETDLRNREKEFYGLGAYSTNSFSIPIDAGIDFKISDRVNVRLATAIHLTSTDCIDNVSSKGTSARGKKGNDLFSFNYFTFRFDLFSQPKVILVEKLFAEMEFDEVMLDDEDGDFVLDPVDECPATPVGVVVDTTGCPPDTDSDGVPDYLDQEKNTPSGAWVNEQGVTVSEEEFVALITRRNEALERQYVGNYYNTIGHHARFTSMGIPEKFKMVDADSDSYISFSELLNAIDAYFDNELKFKVEEIYELNNYFFDQ